MCNYIRLDDPLFKKDSFATQQAIRAFEGKRLYVYGAATSERANGAPDYVKIRFPEADFFRAKDVINAWVYLKENRFENPVQPTTIWDKLVQTRKIGETLNLFIPWGVRPDFKNTLYKEGVFNENAAEDFVLRRVFDAQEKLSQWGIQSYATFMPADLYATDINGLEKKTTDAYFSILSNTLQQTAREGTWQVLPWSVLKEQNRSHYDDLATYYTDDVIDKLVPQGGLQRAFKAAARLNETNASGRAMAYLRERLCEGHIVEALLSPLKLSAVEPQKDNIIDGPLPRLYLIPPAMRFPWLKPALSNSLPA